MKTQTLKLAVYVTNLAFIVQAQGQGAFQNLDFESAQIPPGTQRTSEVPTDAALPGWTAYYQSNFGIFPALQVRYDALSLAAAQICLNDANTGFGFSPLQGTYSAVLYGGSFETSSTITQTGLVPSGTMSLQAIMQWSGAAPIITVGGQTINMVPLQSFPDYTLYGGDISSFAGQIAALSFTEPVPAGNPPGKLILDYITFSPQAVPEPSVFGLIALGSLLFGWRFLNRRT